MRRRKKIRQHPDYFKSMAFMVAELRDMGNTPGVFADSTTDQTNRLLLLLVADEFERLVASSHPGDTK